ncbi:MAG: glycosyltransferase [Oenococcus sp.]|uniref:glycosyltransferase family 2 protein n=1 Tax=Oenococcus TaxID=46254 RepID=UPI0021E87835|nr:glycosyltransferase family 2 protein [Oenococcus kitaharae]MCV3296565.1 glycosyltransferase [Oenococcus kitaharae]
MLYKISVVIRTYNEDKHLEEVFQSLRSQTFQNFEVIVVDSESTDRTLEIAKKYGANIVHIRKQNFNYSYASNIGVQNASGELVCFLSGHSVPCSDTYLMRTLEIFKNDQIGGCYGDVVALSDGSVTEKLFNGLGYAKNILLSRSRTVTLESAIHQGILSCNNACIRRNLLLSHPFVEALGAGGEDIEVAYRILQDGYLIAKVPKLLVRHSHGEGILDFRKSLKSWKEMYSNVLEYIRTLPEEK